MEQLLLLRYDLSSVLEPDNTVQCCVFNAANELRRVPV
jgi:hypothetical protein